MPIINKPAVQLIVEEFIKAGLTHYGTTPGPIYFGIDYATQQKWCRGQADPLSGNIASEQAERTRKQNRLRERHTGTLPDRVGSLRYIGKYRAARLPLPNVPIRAVIARIRYPNDRYSNIVLVGLKVNPSPEAGGSRRLMLGINDDTFVDNSGSFRVTVRW
jgi:hypothetical protein